MYFQSERPNYNLDGEQFKHVGLSFLYFNNYTTRLNPWREKETADT